ncbi:EamA family transporter [Pseudomonas viridiflava]|uniref:EamA family transporter n=1 Tax=Pseudomonas viridiflava TaxID=33069 RepID=UPI000F015877|nr:EamA family transporter [Pseudomonas viridiflava]MEE4183539.1 EamA family transporter [Pseudomonas viridiflava]QVI87501.1 EamA family transporter [Pseudomonas viridiflava]
MLSYAGGLVLLAAVLHAGWNAMLHGNRDRHLSMAWMGIMIASVATVAVIMLPLPAAGAWPYLLASGLVHIVYNISLVRSYRNSDLAVAYPIARGSSPLLVTLGAALFANETLSAVHVVGIVMISGGILTLAFLDRHVSRSGVLAALATGVLIALYTVIDGIGVRQSQGQTLAYTVWMFLSFWAMPLLFVASRGVNELTASLKKHPAAVSSSALGGLVSIAAYGIVIWAMQSGAMGGVSALRETSVVFAALIGKMFLGEEMSTKRWAVCGLVAAGAICLGL